MEKNELRRLSKGDLIDLVYQMKKTEKELRTKLAAATIALSDRKIQIDEAGSIADAVVKVNNIFEVAQRTADEYIDQIRIANSELDVRLKKREDETEAKCRQREEDTDRIIEEKWREFQTRVDAYLSVSEELKDAFNLDESSK